MNLEHKNIWNAIDKVAQNNGISVSLLAKISGLNPTTFNKSKRISSDNKKRWPSTESIAKILRATNCDLKDFIEFFN